MGSRSALVVVARVFSWLQVRLRYAARLCLFKLNTWNYFCRNMVAHILTFCTIFNIDIVIKTAFVNNYQLKSEELKRTEPNTPETPNSGEHNVNQRMHVTGQYVYFH